MKITIDLEDLNDLVAKAELIFLEPRAEKVLLKLLDLRDQTEDAIKQAQAKLEAAALKTNPNVTSLVVYLPRQHITIVASIVFIRKWKSVFFHIPPQCSL